MPLYLGSSEIPKTSASTTLAVDVAGTLIYPNLAHKTYI